MHSIGVIANKSEVHDNIKSSQRNKSMGLCIDFCPHPTEFPYLQHLNRQLTNQTLTIAKDTRTCLPARAPPAIVAGHALAADVVAAGWASSPFTVSFSFWDKIGIGGCALPSCLFLGLCPILTI